MSECLNGDLRDLLPDLAAERLSGAERARVASHVATCAACAAEVELLRAAQRVMTRGVPAVDVARVVAALPKPPAAAESRPLLVSSSTRGLGDARPRRGEAARAVSSRRSVHQWSAWRIAAAATIAVGGLSVAVIRNMGPGPIAHPAASPDSAARPTVVSPAPVTPTQAEPPAVPAQGQPGGPSSTEPDSGPVVDAGSGLAMSGDISELSDGDVETLLQGLDGLDGQPSADPDAAVPALRGVDSP